MFPIFIAILQGSCPTLRTNIIEWNYNERQEYLIAKYQCVTMRLPCLKEFYAINPEGYRLICSLPEKDIKPSKTE